MICWRRGYTTVIFQLSGFTAMTPCICEFLYILGVFFMGVRRVPRAPLFEVHLRCALFLETHINHIRDLKDENLKDTYRHIYIYICICQGQDSLTGITIKVLWDPYHKLLGFMSRVLTVLIGMWPRWGPLRSPKVKYPNARYLPSCTDMIPDSEARYPVP